MATRNETHPFNTSTADFKLWAGFIHNLILTTCGWTQTSDTGQTNPTTVGSAPSNGTYIYEIFQTADTLNGTSPFFVKIEYGQFNSVPSIAITLGTGSDGSGGITNAGTRVRTFTSYQNAPTIGSTLFNCVGSGDASGFRFLMWRDYTGTYPYMGPCFFAVERSRDSSGAYTGDFMTLFSYGLDLDISTSNVNFNNLAFRQQTILAGAGGAGTYELAWLTFQSPSASSGLGSNVALVPVFPLPGYLGNPGADLLAAKGGDFAEGSTPSVSIYGSSHTYFFSKVQGLVGIGNITYTPVNPGSFSNVNSSSFNPYNGGLLFRYE